MEYYKIKYGVPEKDYQKIIDFLVNCWSPNHIFVKSKALLDFQHFDKNKRVYNFVVAENLITGDFDALSGNIPTSIFDHALEEEGDVWGAIWKRRDNIDNPEGKQLGLELFEYGINLPFLKSSGGISLSKDAIKFYKILRWKMGYMHQYYILNNKCRSFIIADNVTDVNYNDPSVKKEPGWKLRSIKLDNPDCQEINAFYRPKKSLTYMVNRFQKHPIYRYDFWGVYKDDKIKTLLVSRDCKANGSKVLRFVDALGELCGYIYPSIEQILQEGKYEYADFLNYGVDGEVFREMGFNELDFDNDELILPNYFEPFEKRNVKMALAYEAKFPYVAFKGDADQDRPNLL